MGRQKQLIMVVTLKTSGTQLRIPVQEFTCGSSRLNNELVSLTRKDAAEGPKLKYINLDEVAAIHAEWE